LLLKTVLLFLVLKSFNIVKKLSRRKRDCKGSNFSFPAKKKSTFFVVIYPYIIHIKHMFCNVLFIYLYNTTIQTNVRRYTKQKIYIDFILYYFYFIFLYLLNLNVILT
jgi:hypothetical protein